MSIDEIRIAFIPAGTEDLSSYLLAESEILSGLGLGLREHDLFPSRSC
jgi:hypothetical protein